MIACTSRLAAFVVMASAAWVGLLARPESTAAAAQAAQAAIDASDAGNATEAVSLLGGGDASKASFPPASRRRRWAFPLVTIERYPTLHDALEAHCVNCENSVFR